MKRISRPFCVIFKRSESEKRAWNMGKELDQQKEELEALKKELAELKAASTTSSKKK